MNANTDVSIIIESLAQKLYDTTTHFEFQLSSSWILPPTWEDLRDDKRMPFYEAADLILSNRHA